MEILQATGFLRGETNRWAELHETAMGNDQLLSNPQSWHKFQPGDELSGDEHNPFFVRASDGRFYDLAPQINLGRKQVTRGIATADVNGDGKLDFAVANQWETSFFYLNQAPETGNFLGLRLLLPLSEGTKTQVQKGLTPAFPHARPAIGAQVSVTASGVQKQIGFVDGGNGHSGKRSPEILFGLGALSPNTSVPVTVRWRDARGQVRQQEFELTTGWNTVLLGE
jgi:hypothetical protein